MSEPIDGSATESGAAATLPDTEVPPAVSTESSEPAGKMPEAPAAAPGSETADVAAAVATEAVGDDAAAVRPAAPAPTGWISPDQPGRGWRSRGCCLVMAVVGFFAVALAFLAIVFLIFLGSQVQDILGGTMQFGTGGSGCAVTGEATTFPATTAFRSVAHLERDVRAGEKVTLAVTYPNGTTETQDETYDEGGACVTQDISPGLAPGHYVLEYRSGTEVLARGGFDITP